MQTRPSKTKIREMIHEIPILETFLLKERILTSFIDHLHKYWTMHVSLEMYGDRILKYIKTNKIFWRASAYDCPHWNVMCERYEQFYNTHTRSHPKDV